MVAHASNGTRRLTVEVLTCSFRLDAGAMVKLKDRMNQLVKKNQKRVLLDLGKTRQADLAGIGMLIERVRMMRSLKGDIKLCNLRRPVLDTLQMVGVSKLIDSYNSREAALKSFCPQ